jgi:hypothetical protein
LHEAPYGTTAVRAADTCVDHLGDTAQSLTRWAAARDMSDGHLSVSVVDAPPREPNGLALGDHPGFEQVKPDGPGDVGDGGLAGLAGGEVSGFPGFSGAVALGAVADGEVRQEDLQQERGEGEIELVRGKKPRRCPSRLAGRAGS